MRVTFVYSLTEGKTEERQKKSLITAHVVSSHNEMCRYVNVYYNVGAVECASALYLFESVCVCFSVGTFT